MSQVPQRTQRGLSITIAHGKARVQFNSVNAEYFEVICKGAIIGDGKSVALTKEQRSWLRDNYQWVNSHIRQVSWE